LGSGVPAEPARLAEIRRGGIVEGLIRGHAVLVDGEGQLRRWVGEPQLTSTAKPFQAASFVESGAASALGLSEASLAIACSSHHGEPGHVQAARRILEAAGLEESALRCGAHLPVDPSAAAELLRTGGVATPIHNNCSGTHAAMLATCLQAGWPTETYLEREHPLQRQIASRLARHAGLLAEELPFGIDGCGLPTFGLSLRDFAAALARAAGSDPAFQSCQTAMAHHPWLIGGTTSFDTALVGAAGETLTAKGGATGHLRRHRPRRQLGARDQAGGRRCQRPTPDRGARAATAGPARRFPVRNPARTGGGAGDQLGGDRRRRDPGPLPAVIDGLAPAHCQRTRYLSATLSRSAPFRASATLTRS
jgi:L-asparaginase II